jgi:hypothetical protein
MKGNEGHWGGGISIITQNFPKSPSILFHPLQSSISQTSPEASRYPSMGWAEKGTLRAPLGAKGRSALERITPPGFFLDFQIPSTRGLCCPLSPHHCLDVLRQEGKREGIIVTRAVWRSGAEETALSFFLQLGHLPLDIGSRAMDNWIKNKENQPKFKKKNKNQQKFRKNKYNRNRNALGSAYHAHYNKMAYKLYNLIPGSMWTIRPKRLFL